MTYKEYKNVYDLVNGMEKVVNENVKENKPDFFTYDVRCIVDVDEKEEEFMFAWLVSKTGTWLVHPKRLEGLFSRFDSKNPSLVFLVKKCRGVYELKYCTCLIRV